MLGVIARGAFFFFFFQAEDGIRDYKVTGVQTCALPISLGSCDRTPTRWHRRGGRRERAESRRRDGPEPRPQAGERIGALVGRLARSGLGRRHGCAEATRGNL